MITLFGLPASASSAPRVCLEEAGADYRFVPITRDPPGPPDWVRSSPHRKVPSMIDGDLMLTESAAIVMHVSDRFPGSGLAPAPGDPDRPAWLARMVSLTATLQAPLYAIIYPQRYTPDRLMVGRVRAAAEAEVGAVLDHLEAELAGRDWLVGDRHTSADTFLWMLVPWTRHMARPAMVRPALMAHHARVSARPAAARVLAMEGLV